MKEIEKHGGTLIVLGHQWTFNRIDFPGMSKLYKELIIEEQKRGAWVATVNQISEL